MNVPTFISDNAPLFVLLIALGLLATFVTATGWLVENISEDKRRNQYRIITDFENPNRFRVQSRWKTLIGWSKWSGWRTYGTLEGAQAGAREQAETRIAKLLIPKVIEDLGVLP